MVKKIEFDYHKYDSLELALKADAVDKMLEFYKEFGWELFEREDDKRYFDIVHVRLLRQHKIDNKDKLQLLQVKMEKSVNKFAAKRRDRHAASTIFGLTCGIVSLLMIALGILLLVKPGGTAGIGFGIPLIAAGVILPLALILPLRKLIKREKEKFAEAYREMGAEITKILSLVRRIRGTEK